MSFGPLAAQAQQPQHPQQRQPQHQQSQGPQHQQPQQSRPQQNGRNAPSHAQGQQAGRYRIVSTVNIRSGVGTNFRRLGQFGAGHVVQVDQVRNGWLHVANRGWISAQFARRA